jgi:hypothetical protein
VNTFAIHHYVHAIADIAVSEALSRDAVLSNFVTGLEATDGRAV